MDASKRGLRAFVIAMVATTSLALGAAALFNWWVDPYGAFGHPVRVGINDRRAPGFFFDDRNMYLSYLIHRGERTDKPVMLIGSSQILYGMDTCFAPEIERLPMLGMDDSQTAQLLQAVGPKLNAPRTFLIQIGTTQSVSPVVLLHGPALLHRTLLSSRATSASFFTLAASRHPRWPVCGPEPFPLARDTGAVQWRRMFSSATQSGYDASRLRSALDNIGASCGRLHHTIVLFTLPVFFARSDMGSVLAVTNSRTAAIESAVSTFRVMHPGCQVEFRNLAKTYIEENASEGAPLDDWQDFEHFQPSVGTKYLEELLAAAYQAR